LNPPRNADIDHPRCDAVSVVRVFGTNGSLI
jgi:hypothetical protein